MDLDKWAAAIDRQQPVYACAVNQTLGVQGLTRQMALLVMCVGEDAITDVHYCRIPSSDSTFIGEQALDPDQADRAAAQRTVFELVRQWLVEHNIPHHESMPDSLMPNAYGSIVDCWPSWLVWDNDAKKFCRQN